MRNTFLSTGIALLASLVVAAGQGSQAANESLWEAARAGDITRITAALEQGADINAKARYDVTALTFAAGNGRLDAVKLLVARGADVNARDTFYRARAAEMASTNGYTEVAVFLVQNGSDIRAVVHDVVSDMRMLAEQRGIEVVADVQGEARLTINEVGLRRWLEGQRPQAAPTGAAKAPPKERAATAVEEGVQIQNWEDDPFLAAVAGADPVPAEPLAVDLPENDHQSLQTQIAEDQPDPGLFQPSTPEFLYWNAASALARGINFWAPLLPNRTV